MANSKTSIDIIGLKSQSKEKQSNESHQKMGCIEFSTKGQQFLFPMKTAGYKLIKGNNKITELRTILQRESQNS